MTPTIHTPAQPYRPSYYLSALAHLKASEDRASDPEMAERERKDQLVKTARKRLRKILEYETEQRREMLEDQNFRAGLQWPEQVASQRGQEGRPVITINRVNQICKLAINEIRQNRAAIVVNPVADGADQDTAEVLQGMARHVEVRSKAEVAYDTASDHQVTAGRGWIRVLIDFAKGKTFRQEIRIARIPNLFAVAMDVDSQEPDYSDARYGFVFEDLDKEAFEQAYPGHTFAPMRDFEGIGDVQDWYPDQRCRVAEYFYVEMVPDVQHELDDGSVILGGETIPDGREIVNSRDFDRPVVKWAKLTAREVLAEQEWPGQWIPIIPVLGDEIWVKGKRQYAGIVRFARDPQRMFNYIRSAVVEAIALAPKSPWLATPEQIENHQKLYEMANTRNIAVLYYNAINGANGQALPPPQRITVEPPIQALSAALAQSDADLKSVTGYYDPSLGAPVPDQSGKAILARQRQSDTANFSFGDNQARAIQHIGEIVLDLFPHVYPKAEAIHIVKPDLTRKKVQINQEFEENGISKIYRVNSDVEMYDVTVSVGPSYQTRRQEAATSMLTLVQHYPPTMQIAGDLVVGNMDWPGAREMADRFRKALPPALQEQKEGQMPDPQTLMQQVQQLSQQVQVLQAQLQPKVLEMQTRERIAAGDQQTRREVALINAQAGIVEADVKAKSAESQMLADRDYEAIQHQLDLIHQIEQGNLDRQHAQDLQEADQQHQQQMQAQQAASMVGQQSYRQRMAA